MIVGCRYNHIQLQPQDSCLGILRARDTWGKKSTPLSAFFISIICIFSKDSLTLSHMIVMSNIKCTIKALMELLL